MLGLVTSLLCLICALAYIYLRRQYRYWKNLGIAGPESTMFVGNMKDFISLKSTEPDIIHKWYQEYRNEPFIGYYYSSKPTLLVIDPELIKAITEVDFNNFMDHPDLITDSENDAVLDSLFTMKGARWKVKRQIFSKLFSPKKLRELSNILEEHNDSLFNEFEEQLKSSEEIELMGVLERHILKIITSFMYSIDPSKNRERQSELSQLSEIFARPPQTIVYRFIFATIFPSIYRQLKLSSFNRVFWDYFSNFTNDLLYSRAGAKDRDDLVSLIGKMKTEGLLESDKIEHNEAVGHLFSFFIAGHHTTMTTLSHAIYQLSLHPQIQEKLRTEVDSILKGKDSITYDSIKQMNYLDGVINETLRLFPLLGVLKRVCTRPYKINDKFTIPKGMDVVLPAYSIHTDPEYFPEPEKFIPERFFDTETPPALFMSFGKGPRTCIGKRFAYISMKTVIAKIVSDYIILPGTKTRTPLEFDPRTFFITVHPIGGLHVKLEKREK